MTGMSIFNTCYTSIIVFVSVDIRTRYTLI